MSFSHSFPLVFVAIYLSLNSIFGRTGVRVFRQKADRMYTGGRGLKTYKNVQASFVNDPLYQFVVGLRAVLAFKIEPLLSVGVLQQQSASI